MPKWVSIKVKSYIYVKFEILGPLNSALGAQKGPILANFSNLKEILAQNIYLGPQKYSEP